MKQTITYVIEVRLCIWAEDVWVEDKKFDLLTEAEDYYEHLTEKQPQYSFRLQEKTTTEKTVVQTIMR